MSHDVSPPAEPAPTRARMDLFLVSLLILFLELACIRWFPAHVLFLTFFTNTVLLACFLGMSLGCLAAGHSRSYLRWTPGLLAATVLLGWLVDRVHGRLEEFLSVTERAPGLVFFGTEYHARSARFFDIPIEAVMGVFFVLLALVMVGPGQELGRALMRLPNRVQAYTINILGSLVGIVLFAGFSWLQLPPFAWFLPVVGIIAYLLFRSTGVESRRPALAVLALVLVVTSLPSAGVRSTQQTFWSPYYRIDYQGEDRAIKVNLVGHQAMVSRTNPDLSFTGYSLPYLLTRDAGSPPPEEVLIIGAGSGNDVSRALLWGAKHIDAVEIDPVIAELGKKHHHDRPYDDPRVSLHLDDGRNFLRSSGKKYDLIIYALVDSLVLHSGYSNIRLESYLFTQQAFQDVQKHLKPNGVFVMYNFFRWGWLMSRLEQGVESVFNERPLVLLLTPEDAPRDRMKANDPADGVITMYLAGNIAPLRKAFDEHKDYWIPLNTALSPASYPRNGFTQPPAEAERKEWWRFRPADIERPPESPIMTAEEGPLQSLVGPLTDALHGTLRPATDNWPFLYLRSPMVPLRPSLSGMLVMAVLSLGLLYFFLPRSQGAPAGESLGWRMFFLGAGFMLIETKAVVHMALLFGSTWMVNSVVFFAVLIMILAANLFVLKVRPQKLWPYYAGLLTALALNAVVPLHWFLGLERLPQVVGSCLLVFAPVLFAGVIFAVSFSRTAEPDRAFGANIAGAMVGGLAEYTSMLLGFQGLMVVAILLYLLSALGGSRQRAAAPEVNQPEAVPVGAG